MIQSVSEQITQLPSNSAPITFTRDCIKTRSTCNWLCHQQGSPLYKIKQGGNYKVTFNVNGTSTAVGVIAFGLYADGVLVPGTTVIADIATAGSYYNVSFDKIVPICCDTSTTLTVASVPSVLTGVTPAATVTQVPTIQNANLTLARLS